jgi:hypothetical protein
VDWNPCDCPAARNARGGHLLVRCRVTGCYDTWMRPLHQYTFDQQPNYR